MITTAKSRHQENAYNLRYCYWGGEILQLSAELGSNGSLKLTQVLRIEEGKSPSLEDKINNSPQESEDKRKPVKIQWIYF